MAEKTVPVTHDTEKSMPQENIRSAFRYVAPAVDIFEEDEYLIVVADIPGADKESVQVNVENGILTIEAAAQSCAKGEPVYREYEMMNFYRQFELSEKVDVDKISAELKNGVLALKLPKVEKAKPKQIQVKVS